MPTSNSEPSSEITADEDLNRLFSVKFDGMSLQHRVLRQAKEKGLHRAEDLANYLRLESLREQYLTRMILIWMLIIVPAALVVLAIVVGSILGSLSVHSTPGF